MIYTVKYLSDGTRYVAGWANGWTLLDSMKPENYKNGWEFFIARVDNENNVLWYKKTHSSYNSVEGLNVEFKNDKLYVLLNAASPQVVGLPAIVQIDDQKVESTDNLLRAYLIISPDGTSKLINLNDILLPVEPAIAQWRDFVLQDEKNLLVVKQSFLPSNAPVINGKVYPSGKGTLIALLNLESLTLTDAIKIPLQGD